MRLFVFAISVLLLTAFSVVSSHAERRVALVVGNAAYRYADRLTNPINDARGMRAALTKLGFEVIYGEDLDQQALLRAIGRFAEVVGDAEVAVIYFAGHGATFADTPYVVPIDAAFSSLQRLPYELIPVETLIGELRRVKGVRIAILDACRDNAAERQLKQRQAAERGGEVSRGLGPMKNPEGLILAYATQYLSTAADVAGANRNSPFTAALLSNIATPDLDVKDMFFRVGREVITATQGRQRPEISISMYDQYVLAPSAPKPIVMAAPTVTPVTSPAVTAPPTPVLPAQASPTAPQTTVPQQTAVAPAVPSSDPCSGAMTVSSPSRCAAPLSVAQERSLQPKDSFRECEQCPEMVVVPSGAFTMGSSAGEVGGEKKERPQHVVTIVEPFAVGKFHVTVAQFGAFAAETRYDAGSACEKPSSGRSWRNPGFEQTSVDPAVCLNWNDAKAYVDWLAKKTQKPYRMLTEAEFEYAARGQTSPGDYPRFWFGNTSKDICRYGNGADQKARDSIEGPKEKTKWGFIAPCDDGYVHTSPAGHFEANGFGLYDMFGNAWQWTADCWHASYQGAPADGSLWAGGDCSLRVWRGGAWASDPSDLRAAARGTNPVGDHDDSGGFRVGRTLDAGRSHEAAAIAGPATLSLAVPDAPHPDAKPGPPRKFYGDEDIDFKVSEIKFLRSNVGGPTPLAISGIKTVTTLELMAAIEANQPMILIDALDGRHAMTIKGAIRLPYAGAYGSFRDQVQSRLTDALNGLLRGRTEAALIFFCRGVKCWESYNAVLRARAAGFQNISWYRGGLDAWEQAGFAMQPTQ